MTDDLLEPYEYLGVSLSLSEDESSSAAHERSAPPLFVDVTGSRLPTGNESIKRDRNVRYISNVCADAFGIREGPNARRLASKWVRAN